MGDEDSCQVSKNHHEYKREFLNREDIQMSIRTTIEQYNCESIIKVYSLYGIGGIGKTELLKKVERTYSEVNKIVFIAFSEHKDILKNLINIRNQFTYAPKFDYLFLKYWELTKNEKLNENYIKSLENQFSSFLDKSNRFSNLISYMNPVINYASDVLKLGINLRNFYKKMKWNSKFKDLLDDTNIYPEKILRQLHIYLAEDIQLEENSTSKKPIFIFDNYKKELLDSDIEWLKEFINKFSTGVFIITSREKLSWTKKSADKFEFYPLSTIPPFYVKQYLEKLGVEKKYVNLIIEKTQCIPIYLDLGIGAYFNLREEDDFEIILESKETLTQKFLNHLSMEEQKIVDILAIIRVFNKDIYNQILNLNHLDYIDFSFEEFIQKSITVDSGDGQNYRINEVIANNIVAITPDTKKQEYTKQYVKILVDHCIFKELPHELLAYCINAFKLCDKYFLHLDEETIDILFNLILFILDTCWITEFYGEMKSITNNVTVKAILKFAESFVERQTDIEKGLSIIEKIPLNELGRSKHINTIICEKNYLLSIKGGYSEAEKNFKAFYDSLSPRQNKERFYVKGATYYSDMLMLRGRFQDALKIFKELEYSSYLDLDISQAVNFEIKKQEGHCYRFNLLLNEAISKYNSNLINSENEYIRLKAYRLTTLCESLCFFEPEEVLKIEKEALEVNNRVKNNNNLAKIYNCLGIVAIHKKDYKKACNHISKAMEINNHTSYRAGNLFSLIAMAYLDYAQKGSITPKTQKNIFELYDNIDRIYQYLLLPIYIINNDEDNLLKIKSDIQWLDFDYTINEYKKFLKIISG